MTSNEDAVFQDILCQLNLIEFPFLDDVGPVIEAYEKKSGNRLSIWHSLIGEFCLYVCKEHVNCTFQIYIGRRRLDGAYVVKRNITYHTGLKFLALIHKLRHQKPRWPDCLN